MKELKVDFEMIGMAMEDVSRDTMECYLDKETGQVIVLSEEISSYAEGDEDSIREDLSEWQKDEVPVAENIRNNNSVGFADNLIYSELNLPPAKRTISLIQINTKEAKEAFRLWDGLENKVRY